MNPYTILGWILVIGGFIFLSPMVAMLIAAVVISVKKRNKK